VTVRRKAKKTSSVENATATFETLRAAHPDAHCELDHRSPFELVVATVLSAQSTDVAVNLVTPELFRRWPTPDALSRAEPSEVERTLGRLGMFRQKAKNIIGLARRLCEVHGGEVPRTLAELVALSGVGRKTANVVLGVAFGTPEGVVVDTHVQRITQRLGWTRNDTPEKIEQDLMALFPRQSWDALSHTLIFHGRRICTARKPACASCPVSGACPSAFRAEQVGRKPTRTRTPPREEALPTVEVGKAGGRSKRATPSSTREKIAPKKAGKKQSKRMRRAATT
jgi:endonuclease III